MIEDFTFVAGGVPYRARKDCNIVFDLVGHQGGGFHLAYEAGKAWVDCNDPKGCITINAMGSDDRTDTPDVVAAICHFVASEWVEYVIGTVDTPDGVHRRVLLQASFEPVPEKEIGVRSLGKDKIMRNPRTKTVDVDGEDVIVMLCGSIDPVVGCSGSRRNFSTQDDWGFCLSCKLSSRCSIKETANLEAEERPDNSVGGLNHDTNT